MGLYESSQKYLNFTTKPLEIHFILIGSYLDIYDKDIKSYKTDGILNIFNNIPYNTSIFIYPNDCELQICTDYSTEIIIKSYLFSIKIPKKLQISYLTISGNNLVLDFINNNTYIENCIYSKDGCCEYSNTWSKSSPFCYIIAYLDKEKVKNSEFSGIFEFNKYNQVVLQEFLAIKVLITYFISVKKNKYYFRSFLHIGESNNSTRKVGFFNTKVYKNYFPEGIISGKSISEINLFGCEFLYFNQYKIVKDFIVAKNKNYLKSFDFSLEKIEYFIANNTLFYQSYTTKGYHDSGISENSLFGNINYYNLAFVNCGFRLTEKFIVSTINSNISFMNCNFEINDVNYPFENYDSIGFFNLDKNNKILFEKCSFFNVVSKCEFGDNYLQYLLYFLNKNDENGNNLVVFRDNNFYDVCNFGIISEKTSSKYITKSSNIIKFDKLIFNLSSTISICKHLISFITINSGFVVFRNSHIQSFEKIFFESLKVYTIFDSCYFPNFKHIIIYINGETEKKSILLIKNSSIINCESSLVTIYTLQTYVSISKSLISSIKIIKNSNIFYSEDPYFFNFINNTITNIELTPEYSELFKLVKIVSNTYIALFKNNIIKKIMHPTNYAEILQFTNNFIIKIDNITIEESDRNDFMDFQDYNYIIIKNSYFYNFYHYRSRLIQGSEHNKIYILNSVLKKFNASPFSQLVISLYRYNFLFVNNTIFEDGYFPSKNYGCSGCIGGIAKFRYHNTIYFYNFTIIDLRVMEIDKYSPIFFFEYNNNVLIKDLVLIKISGNIGDGIDISESNKVVFKGVNASEMSLPKGNFVFGKKNNKIVGKNIKLRDIQSIAGGGVFFLEFGNKVMIDGLDATRVKDLSSLGGGVFYAYLQNMVAIKNVFFQNSLVKKQGGFFFAHISNILKLQTAWFDSIIDEAGIGGGACFNLASKNYLLIFNANFTNLEENESGGVFFANDLNRIFLNQIFVKNCEIKSNLMGGALAMISENNLTIKNSFFINNNANLGAFLLVSQKNRIDITGCIIENFGNRTNNVIYTSNNNIIIIRNSVFRFILHENIENPIILSLSQDKFLIKNNNFIMKNNYSTNKLIENDKNFAIFKNLIFFSIENCSFLNFDSIKVIFFEKCTLIFIKSIKFLNEQKQKDFQLIKSVFSNIIIKQIKMDLLDQKKNIFEMEKCLILFEKIQIIVKKSEISSVFPIIFLINSFIYLKNFVFISNGNNKLINAINSTIFIDKSLLGFNNLFKKNNESGSILSISNKNPQKTPIFLLKKSLFLFNSAKNGGVFYIDFSMENNLEDNILKKNIFLKNSAQNGAVFFTNSLINLKNNLFKRNSAKKGGVFFFINNNKNNNYFKIISKFNRKISFVNNSFQKLRADSGAIAFIANYGYKELVLFRILAKKIENLNKINNITVNKYGKFAGNITKIFIFSNKLEKYRVELRQSFENFKKCLITFIPTDFFGNIVYSSNEKYAKSIRASIDLIPYLKVNEYLQYCLIGNLTRKALNSSKINFFIENTLIVQQNPYFQSKNYSITLFYNKNCRVGERLTETLSCEPCEKNYYSFNKNFEKISGPCESCTQTNFYCFGGFNLTPKHGFSRISKYSTKFLACPNANACLGDNRDNRDSYDFRYAIGICKLEYTGVFCSSCKSGFGKNDKYTCVSCNQTGFYLKLFFKIALKMAIFIYYVYKALTMIFKFSKPRSSENQKEIISTYLIKILTNHLQIIILMQTYPYDRPNTMEEIFSTLFIISENSSDISLECIKNSLGINIPNFFFEVILISIQPIVILLLIFVFVKIRKTKIWFSKIKFIYSILIVVLTFLYSQYLQSVSESLMCKNVGDENVGKNYRLLRDYSIECFTGSHLYWIELIVLPIIIIILIFYPIFLFYKLTQIKLKKQFNDYSIQFQYGFLYIVYKDKFYYWEHIILIKKIIIMALNVIFLITDTINDIFQILIYIFFICLFLAINLLEPYKKEYNIIYQLEMKSYISLLLSFYVVLFAFRNNNLKIDADLKLICSFISIFLQFYFFLPWIKQFYIYEIKRKLIKIIKKKEEKNVFIRSRNKVIPTQIFSNSKLELSENNKKKRVEFENKLENFFE